MRSWDLPRRQQIVAPAAKMPPHCSALAAPHAQSGIFMTPARRMALAETRRRRALRGRCHHFPAPTFFCMALSRNASAN